MHDSPFDKKRAANLPNAQKLSEEQRLEKQRQAEIARAIREEQEAAQKAKEQNNFQDILQEARKHDFGKIVAEQFPEQFNKDFESEFYKNTTSKIKFHLNPDNNDQPNGQYPTDKPEPNR